MGVAVGIGFIIRLRRRVFGSTPDLVIDLAREAEVPVIIDASSSGVSSRIEDARYPVYRYLYQRLSERRPFRRFIRTPGETASKRS